MINNFSNIAEAIAYSRELLKIYGEVVMTESWQGIKKEIPMWEYLNVYWAAQIPNGLKAMKTLIKPDLPWVDKHFEERVGGEPLNPGETYKIWPYYKDINYNDQNFRNVPYDLKKSINEDINQKQTKFSHTYMERYWPKYANYYAYEQRFKNEMPKDTEWLIRKGIRYEYGDLSDVINLLRKEPYTRQAYLPIWFPEDTGVLHGGRVPCSLGYHFIMRHNKLNIHYTIRACDFIRHFRNDIYLTCRLALWLLHDLQTFDGRLNLWNDVSLGLITFDCISLHVFEKERNLI